MIIGIDMGGTHIDGVVIKDGHILKSIKKPTDKKNLFDTIWTSIKELLEGLDKSKIKRINLSTTISTNAIVENKVSKVGMILQTGPGMNLDYSNTGDLVESISGYVDHRGKLVKNINLEEVNEIKNKFISEGIESCGVVSKFSTRNPSTELLIKDKLDPFFQHITMGHSLSGKLNFPRRVHTSYLNAAVNNSFANFASNIKKSLEKENIKAPVYVLKADGGTMSLEKAVKQPVETILSGPAASFMGLMALLGGEDDGILLDIGGTTSDIFFLADGVALFEPLGIEILQHKTLVRSIYSVSLSLGGDSYVREKNGKLKIGPERRDYPLAFGGKYLTVTDAMVGLGLLKDGNSKKSLEGLGKLAKSFNLSVQKLAEKILDEFAETIYREVNNLLDKINSQPVYTVKELLENKKLEAKFINIIGGPAKTLAPILEKKFNITSNYPENYHIANAIGAALAKPTIEINMLADTERKILSVPEVEIYEKISTNYNSKDAESRAIEILKEAAIDLGSKEKDIEAEIIESNSFNMVQGFFASSKNIRVKAQVKPGLIYNLRGEI